MTLGTGARGAQVVFSHVSKRYPGSSVPAVDDLSLVVEPGEIAVLVGPSGCGKTTTMKMVNRLEEPTEGRVLLGGEDVATIDPVLVRRSVGYVIQQIGLFPHQTVGDNIATVPRLLGWPRDRVAERVQTLLALIGLGPEMAQRYPFQLSGGERQRVGVARAMAAEPPVLLMDEPFGAVDPIVRERLQDEFLRLQRQLGTTVLFVTHDINEAIKMGTRVAVMRQGGKLVQYSPPTELLLKPVDEYVAEFLGDDRALKSLALIPLSTVHLSPSLDGRAASLRIPAGTSVRDALSAMLATGTAQAQVEDADGEILGIFSLDSVVKVLATTANR